MSKKWAVTGYSLIGSSHIRKEMPNQDAYGYKDLENDIQVLALSDGHGGAAHKFSDVGSKIAVDTLLEVTSTYCESKQASDTREVYDSLRFDFEETLSKAIQNRWNEKIQADENYESPYQYGCTLLAAVKMKDYLALLQLGDGKIAIVYDDGVVYYPMPRDLRYENNETASLSQPNAWAEMKVVVMPLEANIHMIALASDGVENAYPEDYYDDVHFFIKLAMSDDVDVDLKALIETTAHYSKDDTTAILWKNPQVKMLDRTPSDEQIIWMGDYPKPWIPFSHLTEHALNLKLDYAILLVDALKRMSWRVSGEITLKQLYYDVESRQVAVIESDESFEMSTQRICELVSDLTGLAFQSVSKQNLKNDLIDLKKALKFDYESLCFNFLESKSVPSVVSLSGANETFELFFNSDIYLHQLMPLISDFDPFIGHVIQHEKHKNIWGLVNKTDHTWVVQGSTQSHISPNKTLTIRDGVTAYIYGLPIKFHINNG